MVIPKPVREAMGIRPGDEVFFRLEGDHVVLETKDPEKILEEFVQAVPKGKKLRGRIDWGALYDAQYEEKFRKFL